ncbi:MAG: serine/threonine-protein kinase, partial [Acidobacteriota bacterium]
LVGMAAAASLHGVDIGAAEVADWTVGPLVGVSIAAVLQRGLATLHREQGAGLRLGSYRLEEKLGEGGMGEVWRAIHPLLARKAAVKVIRPTLIDKDQHHSERRFEREARAIAALESPHTVRVYDFGITAEGRRFLAMELLDGFDLHALVKRFGPQPSDRAVAITIQVCHSLAEAHAVGLVHRDIKPANIMLCRRGADVDHVKVLDFGSVGRRTPSEVDPQLTGEHTLLGTPAYLAPEALQGPGAAVGKTDIYGLGCVAYWLLTGRHVFDFSSAMMQIAAHLKDRPEPPSAHGAEVPEPLERLVLACLEKDPEDRPTATALADKLRALPSADNWSVEAAQRWWRAPVAET